MKKVIIFSLFLLMFMLWAVQGMVYAGEYVLWSDTTQGQSNIPRRCKKISQGSYAIYVKNNSGIVSLLGQNYTQTYKYSITFSFDGKRFKTEGLLMSQQRRTLKTMVFSGVGEICVEAGSIFNQNLGFTKLGSFQIIIGKR